MIRLTNLADYAVVLMCHLATNSKELHSAFGLAQVTGVPVPTVSKILGALARANLLVSRRGIHGGFSLRGSPDTISVAAIIEAVDGPIFITKCVPGSPNKCDMEDVCALRTSWTRINDAVKGALEGVALSEIALSGIGEPDQNTGVAL